MELTGSAVGEINMENEGKEWLEAKKNRDQPRLMGTERVILRETKLGGDLDVAVAAAERLRKRDWGQSRLRGVERAALREAKVKE